MVRGSQPINMEQSLILLFFLCITLGAFGGCLTSRYGSSWGLMDRPNEGCSHTRPIPRGGGIGILLPVSDNTQFGKKTLYPFHLKGLMSNFPPCRFSQRKLISSKSVFGRAMVDKYTEDIAVSGEKICTLLGFKPEYDLVSGWQEIVQEMCRNGDL